MDDYGVYFARTSDSELEYNIDYLIRERESVTIWIKGQKDRKDIEIKSYAKEKNKIFFTSKEKTFDYHEKDILINFSIKGVHFFGSGTATIGKSPRESVVLIKDHFFKYERRANFRLVLDLQNKIACQVNLSKELPDFNTYDLSVGGVSLIIEKEYEEHFVQGKIIKGIKLAFNDSILYFENVKVCYVTPFAPTKEEEDVRLKVGLSFEGVPEYMSDRLSRLINKCIKKDYVKKAFEQFLS